MNDISNVTTSVVLRSDTLCALRDLACRIVELDGGRQSVSAIVQKAIDRTLRSMQDEIEQVAADRKRAKMASAIRAARAQFLGRYPDLAAAEAKCDPHPYRGITLCLSWDWWPEGFDGEIEIGLHDTGLHDESDDIWTMPEAEYCEMWARVFDDGAVTDYPPHEQARAAMLAEVS